MIAVFAYSFYLLLAVAAIFIVGRLLFRNGRFYLVEIFHDEKIAEVINRFLFTGYCLVNIGGALRCLHTVGSLPTYVSAFEYVAQNQGELFLLLAAMHYFNLAVLPFLKSFFKTQFYPDFNQQKLTVKKQKS